uniref:Uncharacterized protein n=1 Tax=Solibacter usitatus (strain Ellin6076) TaxID=234267 RepID=Q01XQ4_SOLUE
MVSTEFLRGFLGLLALACSYMLGRTLVGVRKGQLKLSRLYGWLIRTVLCMLALSFRHPVDGLSMMIWGLALAAFGVGFWQASHQKPPEDLTNEIFPPEEPRP